MKRPLSLQKLIDALRKLPGVGPRSARRMAEASSEISHWAEYDYVLINDDVEACHDRLRAILLAERVRRERLHGLTAFVRELQSVL